MIQYFQVMTMKIEIRKEILPIYYRQGYSKLVNGMQITDGLPLGIRPIKALHFHRCVELGVCLTGRGETHIENKIFHYQAGDYQLLHANVPHLSKAAPKSLSKWRWVYLDAEELLASYESLSHIISENSYNGVFSPEEYPVLARIIDSILENVDREDTLCRVQNTFLTGQLLVEASRIGNVHNIGQNDATGKIRPVLQYIREHYSEPKGLAEPFLAQMCGLKPAQFRQRFRQAVGMTLPAYINKTRLSSAMYALLNTRKTILEIATESGYENLSYFNRVFREAFGDSPREIRKQHLNIRWNE